MAFTGVVAISLAGLALANILHPHDYHISKRVVSVSNLKPQVSSAPVAYKPIHYLFFSGNKSYGLVNGSQNLNVKHFSISFWVKNIENNQNSFSRPIKMLQRLTKGALSIPYGWAFDTGNVSRIGDNKLRFYVGSTSGTLQGTNPIITISSVNWTNIVGTFDGINVKLYRNHLLLRTFPLKGTYASPLIPTSIQIGTGVIPNNFWKGYLSDIQIYSRPLSQTEITSIFSGQDISTGLIGRWKLDEGAGNSIHDSSGNGNDGIIHYAIWK